MEQFILNAIHDTYPQIEERYRNQILEYFAGCRKQFDVKELVNSLKASIFQKKVWKALCDIPYGQTMTYKEIAQRIGAPRAYRAVGMACHRNPLPVLIPCHRVIASDGTLGGYAFGNEIKKKLLKLERENSNKYD